MKELCCRDCVVGKVLKSQRAVEETLTPASQMVPNVVLLVVGRQDSLLESVEEVPSVESGGVIELWAREACLRLCSFWVAFYSC